MSYQNEMRISHSCVVTGFTLSTFLRYVFFLLFQQMHDLIVFVYVVFRCQMLLLPLDHAQ